MVNDSQAITRMFKSVSLGAPEKAVGFVMWRVMHRYVREVDRALRDLDLTHLQFTALTLVAWMGRSGELVTQAELARFGDIHPMQVSNILKALEAKAMIRRMPSTINPTAKSSVITLHGLTVLHKALPVVIAVQRQVFGEHGSPDGAFLETLVRLDGAAP